MVAVIYFRQIKATFGHDGLTNYSQAYGGLGTFTDDTQMSLFTAEGLILSKVRQEYQSTEGMIFSIYHALLRWLFTQETNLQERLIQSHGTCSIMDGILTGYNEFFSLRSPENICLSALKSGNMGTMDNPVNNSKGCGGVVRSISVGLACKDVEKAFQIGCECSAITHGHPTGYLSAGTLAALISRVISGGSLTDAINESIRILKTKKNNEETLKAVENAVEMTENTVPSPAVIEDMGAGWVAQEALAISIYSAIVAGDDFRKGILLSVNHSGDSDSTGSITGNILGALYGFDIIPSIWIPDLEMNDLVEEIAGDLFDHFG
ncbi:ADP-ribosylglycohydrolase family protein [Desulfobacula toluolica]|uniref:Predicted ADP-ribosylglycohydrolase n=1 Tax=Desulfobacula toluolica (strain DSM 7467 / Tol2) TaxID=651182 RepID=K0NAW4_DESTT|nr:ADP-ribosylglycohydrolase family protein [Desulfobacula toluolica]CCK81339.1 predicted ADP-ribosylglycohydrolase [Desulfobacula toluolica Tol2]